MRNIFVLLLRYHALLLFIVLEVISLSLVFNRNSFQRATLLSATQQVVGGSQNLSFEIRKFFTLGKVNDSLSKELAILKEEMLATKSSGRIPTRTLSKSPEIYDLMPTKVISNSVDQRNNYITLDIGALDGVEKNMAVINQRGIVGIIKGVSNGFSSGISILHPDFAVSARIDELNENGLVLWEGGDIDYVSLANVPSHVNVAKGQKVVVSGYSYVFPEGTPIGVIEDFNLKEGDAFYSIRVRLSNSMRNLDHVTVVKNIKIKEKEDLEESVIE